jgi:hypothetical protein
MSVGEGQVVYVTSEAPGAWRNGTRVRKKLYRPGDAHPVGTEGVVVGSIPPVPLDELPPKIVAEVSGVSSHLYFVRWDVGRTTPAFVPGHCVEPADAGKAERVPSGDLS